VTTLIPIEYALRHGKSDGIRFHVFSCAPKPRVFELDASVDTSHTQWPLHPGNLVTMRVRPRLGWFTVLALPFLPRFYEWFDAEQDWRYAGGTTERYYRGPTVELVRQPLTQAERKPPTDSAAIPEFRRAQ
jgi:hypothetical protein